MAAKFTDLRRVTPYCLVKLPHVFEEVLVPNTAAHSSETSIICNSTARCHVPTANSLDAVLGS